MEIVILLKCFSPTPRGLEFRPGQDYYFISTSSRRDLQRKAGGSCQTHNMKVIFKVAGRGAEEEAVERSAINRPRERVGGGREEDAVRPIERVGSFRTGLDQTRPGRGKAGGVKQEASTMSGAKGLGPLLALLILVLVM